MLRNKIRFSFITFEEVLDPNRILNSDKDYNIIIMSDSFDLLMKFVYFLQKLGKRVGQTKRSIVVGCSAENILERVRFTLVLLLHQRSSCAAWTTSVVGAIIALFSVTIYATFF